MGGYIRVNATSAPFDAPVVWESDGNPSVLPVPPDLETAYVRGFAPDGTPLGSVRTVGEPASQAGYWTEHEFVALPMTGMGGKALAANNSLTLGDSFQPTSVPGENRTVATYWDDTGGHVISGVDDSEGTAFAVNSSGVYVGITRNRQDPSNFFGGFIGRDGTAQRLNFPGFPETRAFEINDESRFVGIWESPGEIPRGYVAQVNLDTGEQEIYDLGVFPGTNQTQAYAINNENTIVGAASGGPFGDFVRALIWPTGSLTPLDLNEFVDLPGVTLIDAYRINNAGQILVEARLDDGSGFAYYRLDPVVPEPVFSGIILAGMTLLTRRRG